jgi:hypothetical protein
VIAVFINPALWMARHWAGNPKLADRTQKLKSTHTDIVIAGTPKHQLEPLAGFPDSFGKQKNPQSLQDYGFPYVAGQLRT